MAVTFGPSSAPSQVTVNLDSLFGTSLAAYRKKMINNISALNALLYEIISKDFYESQDGGTYIQQPLMYGLTPADSYDGYDELSTLPTDGITDCIYQWRQIAAPIAYNMKEVKQNKQKLVDLVKSRISQAEMGLQEAFAQQIMFGSAAQSGGSLKTPYTSLINGSSGVNPLWMLIDNTPTTSTTVGNIPQNSNSWWQNKTKSAAASTYDGFILEVDQIFNKTALGSGGKPKLVLVDEVSFELFVHALYQKYKHEGKVDEAYPFENITYKGAHFVMDDKVPDIKNGIVPTLSAGAGDPSTLTNGTMAFINPEFMKLIYESDSNFKMLEDDSGKTFFKPTNGDSRVGHVAWMGNLICNNRRKQGVLDTIPRSYAS